MALPCLVLTQSLVERLPAKTAQGRLLHRREFDSSIDHCGTFGLSAIDAVRRAAET
jgi:hypothetical protein